MLQCPDTVLYWSTKVEVQELELFCMPRQRSRADQEYFSFPGSYNSREFGKWSHVAVGLLAVMPHRPVVSIPLNVLLCAGCCAAELFPRYLGFSTSGICLCYCRVAKSSWAIAVKPVIRFLCQQGIAQDIAWGSGLCWRLAFQLGLVLWLLPWTGFSSLVPWLCVLMDLVIAEGF